MIHVGHDDTCGQSTINGRCGAWNAYEHIDIVEMDAKRSPTFLIDDQRASGHDSVSG
jgi:hypothetical protein